MQLQRVALFLSTAFIVGPALGQAQDILDTIRTSDKVVPVVNESLSGTWLLELHRPGAPATQAPVLNLITFLPDGTAIATTSDGTQSTNHGVWVRVGGDRKFVQTMFVFAYDSSRVIATITKVRINVQLSLDGQSVKGTTEIVVMDSTGKVTATIPGGTYTGVRLPPEIPADFLDFQKTQ
jgi:hypothetical protein